MRRVHLLVALLLALARVAAAEPEVALVVAVTDAESGKPLAGAQVVVWDAETLRSGQTGEDGRARFTDLPAGPLQVYAEAERHTAAEEHDVEPGAEVALALGPGVPFEGRILGPTGEPFGPALVQVEAGGTFEGYGEMKPGHAPYARRYSDAEGRFRVLGIPPGAVGTVVVEASGMEVARVAVRAVGDVVRPTPLTIRLVRGCRILGWVTTPDGAPAPAAQVVVVPADDADLRQNPHLVRSSTRGPMVHALVTPAGEDGRYEVHGLALGEPVVVRAEASGFAASEWSEPLTPTADARDVAHHLRLRRAATLAVSVADPEGAVPDVLRVRLGAGMMRREPDAGGSPGVFVFRDLEPGSHVLTVEAEGFLDVRRRIEVAEGARVSEAVVLDRGVAIRGVVRDVEGRPIPGVVVQAEAKDPPADEDGWRKLTAGSATTDERGGFVLTGLRPGAHALDVLGMNVELEAPVVVVAPATDVALVVQHSGTVRLTLRPPAGAALPGRAFVWRHDAEGSGVGGEERIGADGTMVFVGFHGRETLDIRVPGYVRLVRELEPKRGETLDLGSIALDVGRKLHGRLVDRKGNAVAGALVSHADYTEATSDATGAFALEHLPAGTAEIVVDAPGFLPLTAAAGNAAVAAPLTLTLSRGALLRGTVRDAQGAPVLEHWFRVEQPATDRASGWKEAASFDSGEEGAFEVRVPEGPCRISFWRDREGPPVVLVTLDLKEGEERDLDPVFTP